MPAVDYEAEYNNRARVPEHPAIISGWERDAAIYRAERPTQSELGIAYGPHPRQFIDVFHPENPDPSRPIVVFIHGGYWRSLEPRLFSHLAAGANRRGYSVAIPGYRLCPEVRIADIVADVRAACLFLYRRFGRRMVACGHSAGGHLTATIVAADWQALDPGAPANLVRHGLAVSGLFDLTPLTHTSLNQDLRLDEAEARAVSPALWPLPDGIHFTAFVGSEESSEFLRQSRLVTERWSAAGAKARHDLVPGANHFTAPESLADPTSRLTSTLVELCQAAASAAR